MKNPIKWNTKPINTVITLPHLPIIIGAIKENGIKDRERSKNVNAIRVLP